MHQSLYLDEFDDTNFKYDIIFKLQSTNYPNQAYLVLNLRTFIFTWTFALRKIRGCWFQIWQWLFQIPAQKYPNKATFCPKCTYFNFCMKLRILKNSRVVISKMTIFFLKFQPKNTAYSVKDQKIFSFYVKHCVNLVFYVIELKDTLQGLRLKTF